MASKRRRRRHRSRPAPDDVWAVLDGYAALSGARSAHTTDADLSALPAVSRLWEAATCADMTPSRVYLSRRGCWPGRHVRAPGAVVFAWRPASSLADSELAAVTLVALDARGFPVPEARSTVGPIGIDGAVFRAGDRGDVGAVTVQADDEGQLHAANGWLETPWLEVLGGRR